MKGADTMFIDIKHLYSALFTNYYVPMLIQMIKSHFHKYIILYI